MPNTNISAEEQNTILGTLQSNNLMYNPNVPNNSQALGVQGSDNRGYTRTVSPNETVSRQLSNLLDSNSRYIRQNEQAASNYAQSRGMGNSSIAAGAGRKAAIQAGLPIASQDANTYASAAGQNVDAMNANLMQERDIANKMIESRNAAFAAATGSRNAAAQASADRQMQLRMQREALAFEGEQNAYQRQHQFDMTGYQSQLEDMFANNNLGRDLTRMGADYQWRDTFANNDAARQEWLSSGQFNREFYGQMSQIILGAQLNNAGDFFSTLNNYAMENPDVFNAEDYSNFGNFVNNFMSNAFADIIGGIFGGGDIPEQDTVGPVAP